MADSKQDEDDIRAVREQLVTALATLDRLGLRMAGNEVNAAIEALNERLGEATDPKDIQSLQRRYFSD